MRPVEIGEIVWEPTGELRSAGRIGAYATWLATERGLVFDDYASLWQWSVDDLDGFWRSIWDHFDIRSTTPVTEVLADDSMPGAVWFPGVDVNFAGEIARRLEARPDDVALIGVSQTRDDVELTGAELLDLVGRIQAGLRELGIGRGDVVVALLPNIPETVAAYLACAGMGAIWASAAPEFGPQAVVDRFGQLEPRLLLAIDGYRFRDTAIDLATRVADIRAGLTTLEHVVSLDYLGSSLPDTLTWGDFIAHASPVEIEPVPFDHPLCVLFSSGTTGLPKAIVHGHGGLTLEIAKNCALSWDLGVGDRLLFFSTTAWMMWNATVGALITGCSVVCLDGDPTYPDLTAQWRLVERTATTAFGMSPPFVMACAKAGIEPADDFDLGALRLLIAGGAPMPPEGHVWVNDRFAGRVPLILGSGGTDVCTGLVQGCVALPVYAGEMSGKCLGVDVRAFDESGNDVVGELGEMVIVRPMPSMPVRFWGDDDGSALRAAYFEHFPGVMRFGDWIRFSPHGSSLITGRSDATLNRGGVRIGTAEIYRVVEQLPEVADSLVVHLEDPDGGLGELVLFVVAAGDGFDDGLRDRIVAEIRTRLSPRHVPNTIVPVSAIPLNATGKKLELPVKKILLGSEPDSVVSRQAMADPRALDEFIAFAGSRA